jgi:hypothetical protein
MASFWSGMTSASTWSIPSVRATACVVVRLSPVTMTTRIPDARSARSASGVEARIGSATATRPRRPVVHDEEHGRLALPAQGFRPLPGLRARPDSSPRRRLSPHRAAAAFKGANIAATGRQVATGASAPLASRGARVGW